LKKEEVLQLDKKIYLYETKDKIEKIFRTCQDKAGAGDDMCYWQCSKCRLSDKYKKLTGIRLEDIEND